MTSKKTPETKHVTLNAEDMAVVRDIVTHASLMRSTLLNKLIDSRRDIDLECGYPKELTTEQYSLMYDREGVSGRVVRVMPEECWVQDPELYETEESEETEFEKTWRLLEKRIHVWSYLSKIDELSGVGRFGVLLLGLDDGLALEKPVSGINERGEKVPGRKHQLLYLRPFDEGLVNVMELEKNLNNPRYGHPLFYTITFDSTVKTRLSTGDIVDVGGQEQKVHWSRVIHVADNRESSEVYGVPRMQRVFNRLYDIRKTAGGSGEMFWKGGFPGYSFEMDPNARPLSTTEKTALREELAAYADGLQRYLAIQGVTAKSLTPQVADPQAHINVQLELIAISLGIPKRVFMGSEQAQLASTQDVHTWNQRVTRRRDKYLTPFLIRPFIDRMITFGILPEVEDYKVDWPDIDAPSDTDQAKILESRTRALSTYVTGGVDALIPPEVFLNMLAGFSPEQVDFIVKSALNREDRLNLPEPEPTGQPAPKPAAGE